MSTSRDEGRVRPFPLSSLQGGCIQQANSNFKAPRWIRGLVDLGEEFPDELTPSEV